ncbi:MAG: GTP-binding protein [Paraglaciecola sp.]|uniref:Rab family GTPase n=1 Tax=Pseudomonadati TaxID=3379134 RepID=UPI00273F91C2|nr:Rab family GTPase [Paraglaciecola sp.]MDP5029262.1 GTP-binding protein [Paraglaciecola sp.]MDP5040975.1 GTP-binding protein [Paraglaciecola sp.]MDP5129512.1 GTP-binding protein [Paraglaciecola sp.]
MIQKKICLLGATGVGKTSLVKQYVEGIFSEKYLTSIGVKIDKKEVEVVEQIVQLMLWDIEGIDRYCGFQAKYLRGASAYILVTDQTRSQSMTEGLEIQALIKEVADIPGVLAINKADLPATWHWSENEIDHIKSQFALSCITSAKTGEGIESMFASLAALLVD